MVLEQWQLNIKQVLSQGQQHLILFAKAALLQCGLHL